MKTFLASLGGALAMLLVVAAWQTRTSASQFAPASQAWATWPAASTVGPSSLAPFPQNVATPGAPVGVVPIAYTPSMYQPAASNLVGLDIPRATPGRYIRSSLRHVSYREAKPRRNWAKTALVIGGSAGAGAGIGALAGGKKGALVGAAIGGGAASLFEALKH